MKSPIDQQDQDIDQLFRQQQVTVPAELDEAILAQAQLAVENNDEAPSVLPMNRRVTQWFALAATLIIGVSVAPFIVQSPESTVSTDASPASIATPTTMAETAPDSDTLGSEAARNSTLNSTLNREKQTVGSSSRTTVSEEAIITELARETTAGGAAGDNLALSSPTIATPAHRQTPALWVAHILELLGNNERQEAEQEYTLFRKAHPQYRPEFTLDFKPQTPSKPDE